MFHTGDKIPLIKYHGPNVPKFVQQERQQTHFHRSAALNVFYFSRAENYSAAIAPVGQAPSQAPQSMQAPASTTATPPSTVTAPTGQAPSQAPQPTHASETLCAIINSPFISVPKNFMKGSASARLCWPLRKSFLDCILAKQF